ncbi:universal stress protein [Geodermatophilus sp. YIM 151500]|uniref:universal stress protein n=1 Tax=Geodermatophilus sp. YIM 151500 TaxID=2984531 RepID=UPI0021E4487F|nr:universal stress protein [Geodermatophilus sp. YIM 151500]MCV2487879.1 universal stress protein [Geodermatophilus sp. YIM 151500]
MDDVTGTAGNTDVRRVADVDGGILVAHDGSEGAQVALAWAARLAERAGFGLHVVRAWSMTSAPRPRSWAPGYVPPIEDFERAVHDELCAHVAAVGVPDTVKVRCWTVHAAAARGLIESSHRADLMVVGARGHGGFTGLLLGSVSEQCVRHAHCPVTVVRQEALPHGRTPPQGEVRRT